MAHRRIGVDILQVGLYDCTKRSVHHRYTRKYEEYPTQFVSGFGHKIYSYAETAVSAEFHQYACVQHRHRGRCRSVTVGTPSVERKQSTEHTETQERYGKYPSLMFDRNTHAVGYIHYIECSCSRSEEYTDDTYHQECRTTHKHKGQLHCRILFFARPPQTYKQIHRYEGNFVEHKHREQIYGDEKAEYADCKQAVPEEKLFCHIHIPRRKYASKYDNRRQGNHHYRYAVYAQCHRDIKRSVPRPALYQKHLGIGVGGSLS